MSDQIEWYIMAEFTELELKVIGELKEVYDPILMNEQEVAIEFQRIANSVGIEADDVRDICERWEFSKISEDMAEMDRRLKEKNTKKAIDSINDNSKSCGGTPAGWISEQEDDGYHD